MTSPANPAATSGDDELRRRIVHGAAELLGCGGRNAVTTRAVATHVGVSPPTIYRLFGEKNGLLSAVGAYGYARFLAAKAPLEPTDDPVADLLAGWTLTVEFGLENPELFLLIYGEPQGPAMSAAPDGADERMQARIRRVAAAGRLRVDEWMAAAMLQASARGTVLESLERRAETEDRAAFISAMGTGTMTAIVADASTLAEPGRASAARTLRANLPGQTTLSPAEQQLLLDWLDRLGREAEPHEPGLGAA